MSTNAFKPGDLVLTPSGRIAKVDELRPDGRRDLRYIDLEGGYVALRTDDLRLMAAAPVRPWTTRLLR